MKNVPWNQKRRTGTRMGAAGLRTQSTGTHKADPHQGGCDGERGSLVSLECNRVLHNILKDFALGEARCGGGGILHLNVVFVLLKLNFFCAS